MKTLGLILSLTCLVAMVYSTPHIRRTQGGKGLFSKSERLPEEVLEEHEDFNLVRYKESKWVCTKMVAEITKGPLKRFIGKSNIIKDVMDHKEKSEDDMFMKLFGYIDGGNSEEVKIDMTSPVTTLWQPVTGKPTMEQIEMCFWTGTPWQDKELPTPNDKDVYIQERPSMEVFVRRFGGWAMSWEDWMEHKQALEESISDRTDVEDDPEAGFYTVGYDSPWQPINRRNEVWIGRKSASDNEKKSILHEENLETTEYTVISENEKFELREYPATKWVCTKMTNINPTNDPMNGWQDEFSNNPFAAMGSGKWEEQPSSKMFNKLFAYIAGKNVDGVEVQMTSPVSHLHDPTDTTKEKQEMCFWLGSMWQNSPLEPIDDEVYIQERPLTKVYVRKFGGFALSYDDFHQHYQELKDDIKEESNKDIEGRFYQISYDSPFVIKDRHNEVWIEV